VSSTVLRKKPDEVDRQKDERHIRHLQVLRGLPSAARRTDGVIYLFSICEYGGEEIAWCTLTCEEGFADGFELGVGMRINEETHYIVREEIGEEDVAGRVASVGPWIQAA
jgi:hypothetical protein